MIESVYNCPKVLANVSDVFLFFFLFVLVIRSGGMMLPGDKERHFSYPEKKGKNIKTYFSERRPIIVV